MIDEINPTEIPDLTPTVPISNRRPRSIAGELRQAVNTPTDPEDMHHRVVSFGKYKGERWTRVPVQWLRWCANQMTDPVKGLAIMELKRRGSNPDHTNIEISAHSIDRASLNLYEYFIETANSGEGIHSWLARIAREAYDANDLPHFDESSTDSRSQDVEVRHKGIKFVFMLGRFYPVLKTIHKRRTN